MVEALSRDFLLAGWIAGLLELVQWLLFNVIYYYYIIYSCCYCTIGEKQSVQTIVAQQNRKMESWYAGLSTTWFLLDRLLSSLIQDTTPHESREFHFDGFVKRNTSHKSSRTKCRRILRKFIPNSFSNKCSRGHLIWNQSFNGFQNTVGGTIVLSRDEAS